MFFNLIPLPPLDGFGIITQIFRLDRKPWYGRFYQLGPMFLMIIILFDLTSYLCDFAGQCIMDLFTDHEYIFLMIHKGPVPEKRPAEFRRVKSAFRMKSLCVSDWNFRRAGK